MSDDHVGPEDIPELRHLVERGVYLVIRRDGSEADTIDGYHLTAADLRKIADVMDRLAAEHKKHIEVAT
jgi:hypothetical protein